MYTCNSIHWTWVLSRLEDEEIILDRRLVEEPWIGTCRQIVGNVGNVGISLYSAQQQCILQRRADDKTELP